MKRLNSYNSSCTYACFVVCYAVVGVKLNISFWMNSFMNATLKVNVSCVNKVYLYCIHYLWHLYLLVYSTHFLPGSHFLHFSARMRSVAVSGMTRYSMTRPCLQCIYVLISIALKILTDDFYFPNFFHLDLFIYRMFLNCLYFHPAACRLCDPGRWGISSHVQSGWVYHSGELPAIIFFPFIMTMNVSFACCLSANDQ